MAGSTNYSFGKTFKRNLIEPPQYYMRRNNTAVATQSFEKSLIFPSDLSAHFMALLVYRFDHRKSGEKQRFLHKTILLPIPPNLLDTTVANYSTPELGAIGGTIADAIAQADAIGSMYKSVKAEVGKYYEKSFEAGKQVMQAEGGMLGKMEAFGRTMQTALDSDSSITQGLTAPFRGADNFVGVGLNKFFGNVPNPHITSMFRGVGLKTHNFTWRLAPASSDESGTLVNIINTLKQSMLPVRNKLMLDFPDEVEIYLAGGMHSNYLYPFKAAVIRNMAVNYTPDGTPSFFGQTGAPTAAQITLDFLETAIHTREDYNDHPLSTGSGYDLGGYAPK